MHDQNNKAENKKDVKNTNFAKKIVIDIFNFSRVSKQLVKFDMLEVIFLRLFDFEWNGIFCEK